jgi:hypothetical protein
LNYLLAEILSVNTNDQSSKGEIILNQAYTAHERRVVSSPS